MNLPRHAVKLFLGAMGGRWSILFWVGWPGIVVVMKALASFQTWWLGWFVKAANVPHNMH
jgi:hypothetical protein